MPTPSAPLLPYRIAKDTIDELKGFVSTMLFSRDVDTREAVLKCLFDKAPIVRGPFIELKRPFRGSAEEWPLDSRLHNAEFSPYLHQMKAYQNLKANSAKNTLITTGTGSGKSECFILPILDYVLKCKAERNHGGVKALVLYPMNALIEDQGERLSQLANELNANLPERDRIRVGRYTGNNGRITAHDPKNPKMIIDHRESLCENPPDILLTNYRMLDFMLLRPDEQNFWLGDTPDLFKYLVLDELHTFDGAQGADVAALIRRLRLKINSRFVCVGTSATVGDRSPQSLKDLCNFATTLFGSKFDPANVILEDRYEPSEILQPADISLKTPTAPIAAFDLMVKGVVGYEEYLNLIIANWDAPKNQGELGLWLLRHPVTHQLFDFEKTGIELSLLAEKVGLQIEILGEFLDLLAFARKNEKFAVFPLTTQVWTQSVPYLMRRLHKEPHFLRPSDREFSNVGLDIYLPAVNCRDCGLSGWLTMISADPVSDNFLFEDNQEKIRSVFYGDQDAAFIFPKTFNVNDEYRVYHAAPGHNRLYPQAPQDVDSFEVVVAIQKVKVPQSLAARGLGHQCPSCASRGTMGVSFFSEAMMGSVLANAFLASGANPTDKKYLIFNDSVQDTSHQAGYLSARGFRFNFRRYLLTHIKRTDEAESLQEVLDRIKLDIGQLWKKSQIRSDDGQKALFALLQILPKDLWERWTTKARALPFNDPKNLTELQERLEWESWLEFSVLSELGWSLRKTTLVALEPKTDLFDKWKSVANNLCQARSEWQKLQNVDSFIYGIIRRFVTQGALYRADLNECYNQSKFSYWPLQNAKPHLASLLYPRSPRIINSGSPPAGGKRPPVLFMASGAATSWFTGWAKKHGISRQSSADYYHQFLERLAKESSGLKRVCQNINPELMALDTEQFDVHWRKTKLLRCDSCNHMSAVALTISSLSCTQMHCPGRMVEISSPTNAEEQQSYLTYMARQYERTIISPSAHSHNSQLEGEDRQRVEQAFKRNLLPGDSLNDDGKGKPYYYDHPINILACTPTMEMGIDIGTLSGVALRSFPRTLSNARQRLGRSGRSTGNAFNAVIAQQKPHDNHYWNNPEHFFSSPIRTPGCDFRNKQILLRQFNAYSLDEFARTNKELRIPKSSENANEDLSNNIYYQSLFGFLKTSTAQLVNPFLDAIELGLVESEFARTEIAEFISTEIRIESFSKAIQLELKKIDKKAKDAAGEAQESEKLASSVDGSSNLDTVENITQKKRFSDFIKRQLSQSDYILKKLADLGLLPNYAFPEEGVRLDYSVRLPVDHRAINFRDKFKFKQGYINRGPVQALLEFAPGGSYYTDGFKVPITRLGSDFSQPVITPYLCCRACGALTKADGIPGSIADCIHCHEEAQPIVQLLDFRAASSISDFSDAQITDREEQRERHRVQLETFINHANVRGSDKGAATWVSSQARIAIEFRTNAEIHHLNRNLKYRHDEAQYYEVCKHCLAIPARYEDQTPIFNDRGVNRHAVKCVARTTETGVETIKVALGRKLNSDVISILADGTAYTASMHALLNFAMQTYLRGSPAHLVIGSSKLNIKDHGHRNIITLYDNVPGGTGHLRSLMQFSENELNKSTSGLRTLARIFTATLQRLTDCPCQSGCYNCLLSYENQYSHSQINKRYAINWLNRFIEANDWDARPNALSIEVGHDSAFGNVLEEYFVDGLRKVPHTIPGVERCREIYESNTHAFEISSRGLRSSCVIQHTAFTKIPLDGKIPYTLPDFTIFREGREAGFIYVDGMVPHLSPGLSKSVFETADYPIRCALIAKYGVPVLTFSHDMVNSWRDAVEYSRKIRIPSGPEIPHIHKIIAHISSPDMEIAYSVDQFAEDMKALSSSFVAYELAKALGVSTEGYLSKANVDGLRNFINTRTHPFSIGGLKFDNQSKMIVMEPNSQNRLDSSGQITKIFKLTWELFWILWMIDRSLVTLKT